MELRSANSMSMEMKMEYLATIFTPKFDAQVIKTFFHNSRNFNPRNFHFWWENPKIPGFKPSITYFQLFYRSKCANSKNGG